MGKLSKNGVLRGLTEFWNETGCYMLTRPQERRGIGSIYKQDPLSLNTVYIDDLKNLVMSSESFEYPRVDESEDVNQVNNSTDFSDRKVKVDFFENILSKIANFIKVGGSWQDVNKSQLVSYFFENSIQDVSIGNLRAIVQSYPLDKTRFHYDRGAEYFIAVQARRSRKFAVCTSDSKSSTFQLLAKIGDVLEGEANSTKNLEGFSCALSPSGSTDGLAYALKLVPLDYNQNTRIINISDPFTQPMQLRPIGFVPESEELSEVFL
jgi:hypothetical protein